MAGLLILATLGSACHLPDVPNLDDEERKARALPQTSFLFAGDGTLITTFHAEENREIVPLDDIPLIVRRAVVAVEDRRFYSHSGVDFRALVRAAYVDATEGHVVEGGSTITEQYVKNRYLGTDRTISRKVKEAILAWQLEREMSKRDILAGYLNTVYFGEGAYGIQAAAQTYFSEPASSLDVSQAALLAGLIRAPSTYDPVEHPDLALARRATVLRILREAGVITPEEYGATLATGLGLRVTHREGPYEAPYFVQFVKQWVASNPAFGDTRTERESLLYRGGLRITTTLDPRLQRAAEDAVNQVLVYRTDPYGAMTVIDPRTGEIKAMVGGRDYFSQDDPVAQVNLATGGSTGRQAGSTFKPFALVAAMLAGISPHHVYDAPPEITLALPGECQAPGEPVWPVHNFDGSGDGRLTVEQATIYSVNVVYAQIVRDLGAGDPCAGAAKVVDAARALGVSSSALLRMGVGHPLQAVPSAVLGSEQVNTVEMASAYATLANVGYRLDPVAVTKVTDSSGKVLWQNVPEPRLAVDRSVAYVADQILQKVVAQGTGTAAAIGRPTIGKTGTAEEYRDAWFVGAVPQLSAAVWVGFPQNEDSMVAPRTRIPEVLGGTWPAQIWRLFMSKATEPLPVRQFPLPVLRNVIVPIDTSRGCQANRYTPPALIAQTRFLVGTQPAMCTSPSSYRSLAVPSVIGLPVSEAASDLERAGLRVTAVGRPSVQPAGTVVGQDPPSGEEALQASGIRLEVAVPPEPVCPSPAASPTWASPVPSPAGPSPTPSCSEPGPEPAVVPNVFGMSREEALVRLQDAGYGAAALIRSRCAGTAACSAPADEVWKQSPAAGDATDLGTTVTVWVDPST